MNYVIEYIPARRRTIEIKIKSPTLVTVRYPAFSGRAQVEDFVSDKKPWIESHIKKMAARMDAAEESLGLHKLSIDEINALADEALEDLPRRVSRYAPILGVTVGRVTIRNQRSRWGSCSSKGNLNFNCLLMQTPEFVRDYIVVHELCHRREMNHSPRFWALVESVLPDYKKAKKWLSDNGNALLSQLQGV